MFDIMFKNDLRATIKLPSRLCSFTVTNLKRKFD